MENKKAVKSDLENRRPTFLKIGLIASLAFALMAFEYTTWSAVPKYLGDIDVTFDDVELPPLVRKETVETEPKKEKTMEKIKVVDVLPDPEPEPDPEPKKKDPPVLFALDSIGDTEPVEPTGPTGPFIKVEKMPHFSSCSSAKNPEKCTEAEFIQHLKNNLRVPRDMQFSEKAFVYFVVAPSGEVVDIKLMNKVHPSLDKELHRVFDLMPDLVPGMQRGKAVPVMYTIPVNVNIK